MSVDREAWQRHEQATARGEDHYVDPSTGTLVFTELGLRRRGRCCGSGCRHCPYAHRRTPLGQRGALAQVPTWLTPPRTGAGPVDVLFWSGGKDSFLAYRALRREGRRALVLLTTFDAAHRRVAHQEIHLDDIVRQANHLKVPLIGVPLHSGQDYLERVAAGVVLSRPVTRLVFGDLHLDHVRAWREASFAPLQKMLGAELDFPLWGTGYDRLLTDLEASGVPCVVSAVDAESGAGVHLGERFDRQLLARLPPGVDPFGERGEFHTLARVWDVEPDV